MASDGSGSSSNAWLFAIIGSATSWAVADLMLDVTIGEEKEPHAVVGSATIATSTVTTTISSPSNNNNNTTNNARRVIVPIIDQEQPHNNNNSIDDETTDLISTSSSTSSTTSTRGTNNSGGGTGQPDKGGGFLSKRKVVRGATSPPESHPIAQPPPQPPSSSSIDTTDHHHNAHLSGDQNTAAAGLVTMIMVYAMCYQRWTSHRQLASDFESKRSLGLPVGPYSGVGGVWSPFQDYEWWIAAIGGLLLFWHYQTLYTAYDTAPSTVINPLLQVSSTWVLLGTAIPSLFTGEPFIQPFDLFCYVIIVVGGLLPSIEGDMWAMLKPAFWRQSFVKNAVLSEIALGLYDLLLSHVLKVGRLQMSDDLVVGDDLPYIPSSAGPNVLENEFFFIAWCWFCVTFAFAYALHPHLQEEYFALRAVPIRLVLLAGLGQIFMFVGYYSSQFGYSWFYQASVVHAAEASMAQGLNLMLAYVAKQCFNLGRDSAVSGMKFKMASVCVVSVGLFLIAFKDLNNGSGGGGGHG